MRTLSISSVFFALAVFLVTLFTVKANAETINGRSNHWLGDYSLTKAETPMQLKGASVDTWVLKYANSDSEIKIGIVEKKKCREYIVKTESFEIQYTCNKNGLGVKRIAPVYASIEENRNYGKIDAVAFEHQHKLSNGMKSKEEAMSLIACYFPILLKDEYKHVIE